MPRALLTGLCLLLLAVSAPARAAVPVGRTFSATRRDTLPAGIVPEGLVDPFAGARPRDHGHGSLGRAAAILGVGGAAALWALDEESADAAQRQLDQSHWEFASDLGNVYGDGLLIGGLSAGIWAWGRAGGHETAAAFGGDLCEAFLLGSAAVWAIKVPVNRTRPGGGGHSFPSGHTTVAFAVVPVVGHHLGWKASVPAAALATATAMGRMEDRRHFLSDVLFGAALGLVCGDLVTGKGFLPGHARVAAAPGTVGVTVPF